MSTQENLIFRSKGQQLYTPLLALLLILLVSQSNWVWQSLYLQFHTIQEISRSLLLMALVVFIFFIFIKFVLGNSIALKLIDLGIATLFTYVGFTYLKQVGLIPHPTTVLYRILAVVSAIALCFLIIKINADTRKRLHLACIFSCLIFVLSPLVIAKLNSSKIFWPSPSAQASNLLTVSPPRQNTIIFLLDELSAGVAGPIIAPLISEGLNTQVTNIDPAGKNTLNVIPAIWTRTNFDQSVACGPTHLCSGTNVLDFQNVWATSDNIDVVSFYHHYCSIQGLRSCTFEHMPKRSVGKDLVCSFPVINSIDYLQCDYSLTPNESFIALRENMENSLMNAPFWEKGGVLYAHLMVPHPLMGSPQKKLNEEYRDNIENGAALVKHVAQKAKLAFGDDFKIIIFSDHPLRPDVWCAQKGYIRVGCEPDDSQISTQVPLIIATPTASQQPTHSVTNNMFVFDLLF